MHFSEDLPPNKNPNVKLEFELDTEREAGMKRKAITSEQIIRKLREAELLLSQGQTV
jgi:hypothetical protein